MPTRRIEPVLIDEIDEATLAIPPFPNDVTLEVFGNGKVLGYVFCCASAQSGVTQEQRWLLFEGPALSSAVTFGRPPETVDPRYATIARCTSLAAWKSAIQGSWPAGAWYVKVNAACFNDLMHPETRAPAYPALQAASLSGEAPPGGGGQQMVDRQYIGLFHGAERVGDAYGTRLADIGGGVFQNLEYWVTRGPAAVPMSIDGGSETQIAVQGFLDNVFTEGSTLTIASCRYLQAKPANP